MACLVECARWGSVRPSDLERQKIQRILSEKPGLTARLSASLQETPDGVAFAAETERVEADVIKLARGHALYELHEPMYEAPTAVGFAPMETLGGERRNDFETPPPVDLFPEVGSRAMQRMFLVQGPNYWSVAQDWIEVQENRYRYLVLPGGRVIVRMVLSEYLACEVVWGYSRSASAPLLGLLVGDLYALEGHARLGEGVYER